LPLATLKISIWYVLGAEGKCCFIKLWSSLELFGFEFLSCTEASTNQKGLIGISKDKVKLSFSAIPNVFYFIGFVIK